MTDQLAAAYRRFAHLEARGVSDIYADWAMSIADDADVLELIAALPAITWISNEGPQVLPEITEQVEIDTDGRTILAVDGRPIALMGPHGQSYQAI